MIDHDDIHVSGARGGNLLLKIGNGSDIDELIRNHIHGNRQPAAVSIGVTDQFDEHEREKQRRDERISRGLVGKAEIINTLRCPRFDKVDILGTQHFAELLVLEQLQAVSQFEP